MGLEATRRQELPLTRKAVKFTFFAVFSAAHVPDPETKHKSNGHL